MLSGSPAPEPDVDFTSPSLFAAGTDGPPAFEMKFLLNDQQAHAVEALARGRLSLDPHADPALGNAYLTTSLYTDTPGHDVYFRRASFGGCKYRVRRYGSSGPVFAERKERKGDRVRKWRAPFESVSDRWFHDEVRANQLRPVCRIAYERVAFAGTVEGGPVRVTFDRQVRGETETGWAVDPVRLASPVLLAGRVICEFKFRTALPALFKGIVLDLDLDLDLAPSPVSKYRLFMQTLGLPLPGGG